MEIKNILKKPYTGLQKNNFIVENNHKKGYEIRETEETLEAWGADENDLLIQTKQTKIQENDLKRDEALNQGVEYKGVLFDSDTDQKVNLLAIVSTMEEQSALLEGEVSAIADEGGSLKTIIWYGKDNQPLECSKEDLINIGGLITQLHTFCWNKNAEIKALINEAETIEEVEAIVIDYTMPITVQAEEELPNLLEKEEEKIQNG